MLSVRSFFWLCFLSFVHFQYFSILNKCNMESATLKKCNMEIVDTQPGPPRTSKMEIFVTIFNGFVNYCCKALHLRYLWWSWIHIGEQISMNNVQQKKIARYEECSRRRMQNKNIAKCNFFFYSLCYVDIQCSSGNLQQQYKQDVYTLIKIDGW